MTVKSDQESPFDCADPEARAAFIPQLRAFHLTDAEWVKLEALSRPWVDAIWREFGDDRTNRARGLIALFGRMLATVICQASVEDSYLYTEALNDHFAIALERYGGPPLRLRLDPKLGEIVTKVRAEKVAWNTAEPPAQVS